MVRRVDDAKAKAAAVYNAAAEYFDHPALGFWDRFGQATIDRLDLHPGAQVLDVCCGTGASAIPAARRVGPTGRVVAVDVAENLLALAADKAGRNGLDNLEFRHQDVETLDYPPASFDTVVIVFGIFFLPDMTVATARLWQWVKSGGQLAVTTWGPGFLEPASSIFWSAVSELRPDLDRGYNPWDQLTDPEAVRRLLVRAGAHTQQVEPVAAIHRLTAPAEVRAIMLGTGFRGTYDAMTAHEQQLLEKRVLDEVSAAHINALQTNVIYAVATKS
jgi:ubiquinone/menaquinone biosynthesis C-methylase UbiE